jgi:hypothetical protein
MTKTDQLQQDLDYVAGAVRRRDRPAGVPAIYFLWAAIVAIGFALPDFAPRQAGPFWLVSGIGGGLLSWWLGERDARRHGILDVELGRRYGLHWCIAGIGFLVSALPIFSGDVSIGTGVSNFLLVAGMAYALAGVHLERPLLWSGLAMLIAYVALTVFSLPYTWTLSGLVIGASLLWAGLSARRTVPPGGAQG